MTLKAKGSNPESIFPVAAFPLLDASTIPPHCEGACLFVDRPKRQKLVAALIIALQTDAKRTVLGKNISIRYA